MYKLFIIFLLSISSIVNAIELKNFSDELNYENIEIVNINGNGSSTSLHATIINHTNNELTLDVFLNEAMFLVNDGIGQNMVATQVFNRDGSYTSHEDQYFYITIAPFTASKVKLIAYCIDFEKNNPIASEKLTPKAMPRYLQNFFTELGKSNEDNYKAIQIAIWLAHDHKPEEIRRKFSFSNRQLTAARKILRRYY